MNIRAFTPSEIKGLVKNYRVPALATIIFVCLAVTLIALRLHEYNLLSKLFSLNSAQGANYSALLSRDRADAFIKNKIKSDGNQKNSNNNNQTSNSQDTSPNAANPASAGSPSPTTPPPSTTPAPSPSPSPTTPPPSTTPAPSPSPSPTTPPPNSGFYASFHLFQHSSTYVSGACDGGQASSSCYRTYRFDAVIRHVNGPGAINYVWRNSAVGYRTGTIDVSSGENYQHVFTEIQLNCSAPGPFITDIHITSPNQISSQSISLNHQC